MAAVNLISLWLSPLMSQRLMLGAFNILSHFIFMQQLSWYVPSNGDVCPNIGNVSTITLLYFIYVFNNWVCNRFPFARRLMVRRLRERKLHSNYRGWAEGGLNRRLLHHLKFFFERSQLNNLCYHGSKHGE